MLIEKIGDLFDSEETYLCHQCNCVTEKSAHLAKSVFTKYPYADVYSARFIKNEFEESRQFRYQDTPGTIRLCGDGEKDRYVIAMFAQFYPGNSNNSYSKRDGYGARLKYFKSCLKEMESLEGSFAFPYRIGCGAAGGHWEFYKKAIEEFSERISGDVVIYQKVD